MAGHINDGLTFLDEQRKKFPMRLLILDLYETHIEIPKTTHDSADLVESEAGSVGLLSGHLPICKFLRNVSTR